MTEVELRTRSFFHPQVNPLIHSHETKKLTFYYLVIYDVILHLFMLCPPKFKLRCLFVNLRMSSFEYHLGN